MNVSLLKFPRKKIKSHKIEINSLFLIVFLFNISKIIKREKIHIILNNSIDPIGKVVKLKFFKLFIINIDSSMFIALKGIQNNDTNINVKIDDIIFNLSIFNLFKTSEYII